MERYSTLSNFTFNRAKITVAIGTFDGVHVGHQQVITRAVELAQKAGGQSAVLTFNNHPLSTIAPSKCPPQILSQDDKERLIASLGVDYLLSIDFTERFLRLSPDQFAEMLCQKLSPNNIVVGSNFYYGYKSAGSVYTLSEAGKKYGFTVHVIDEVKVGETIASSTSIRNYLIDGDVKQAAVLLGRHFQVRGAVITGDERGRTLGFPTANVRPSDPVIVPGDGVYAVHVTWHGAQYNGICNIGPLPTFNIDERRIEVHIMNFSHEIYGEEVIISFVDQLRGVRKFSNREELIKQLHADILKAEAILK